MSRGPFRHLVVAMAVILTVLPVVGCDSDGSPRGQHFPDTESTDAGGDGRILDAGDVLSFVSGETPDNLDEELAGWSRGHIHERLAAAEALLPLLVSKHVHGGTMDQEQVDARHNLSSTAGRAALCLEHILGISLPAVRVDPLDDEHEGLRVEASRLVETYRERVMVHAAENRTSPKRFAELKSTYCGQIMPIGGPVSYDAIKQMDSLLAEWSPIGRRYEDLVSIIGVKGTRAETYRPGAIRYRVESELRGIDYLVIVRDGIIVSVHRHPM